MVLRLKRKDSRLRARAKVPINRACEIAKPCQRLLQILDEAALAELFRAVIKNNRAGGWRKVQSQR